MKRSLIFFLAAFVILSVILSGCGGSGDSSSSYSLPEGNHALLGPIAEADVKICELAYTDNFSCIDLKTDKYGTFKFNNTLGWTDDRIVLVTISGGQDIDADDDGFLDANPTKNNGVIHGFAKVGDLKNGNVNITVLTDIVYNSVSNLCSDISCSLSEADLESALNSVSEDLVNSGITASSISKSATNTYFGTVTKFNPLEPQSTPLKISQSIISDLAKLYLAGDSSEIKNTMESKLMDAGIVMNSPTLLSLKTTFKLSILKPSKADITILKGGQTIADNLIWYDPKKDNTTNYQIEVTNINTNYEIVKWMGCTKIYNNGTTCSVENVQEDRIIMPIILPKLKPLDNLTVVDLTGFPLTFNNMKDNVSLDELEITDTILDDITITTTDQSIISILSDLKEGDIVVNKVEPIFFRKVKAVTKYIPSGITYSAPAEFNIITEFVPIQTIIPRGYLATTLTPESIKPVVPVQLISSEIKIGKASIPFDPTKQYLMLKFNEGKVFTKSDINFDWETVWQDNFSEKLDDDNTTLSGYMMLRPYVDLNIGWDVDIGWSGIDLDLEGIYLTMGSDVNISGKFEAALKKKLAKHGVIYDGLRYNQVFTIYGIPIKVTLKLPLTYGVKGAGKGADFDNAYFVGNVSLDFAGTSSPYFQFVYNGGTLSGRMDAGFQFSQSSDLNIGANGFAYVGVEPGAYIYGVGVAMKNYVGPYLKIDLKTTQSASGTGTVISLDKVISENYSVSANVQLDGAIGIGYYGRIVASLEWDNSIAKKVVEKVNDAIRGKYTEFWKEWPLYTVKKEFDTNNQWGVTNRPGELKVTGDHFVIINSLCGQKFANKTLQFQLENIGDNPINWKVDKDYTGSDIDFTFSKSSGTLNNRSSDNITLTISSDFDGIACNETRIPYKSVKVNINFKQVPLSQTSSLTEQVKASDTILGMVPLIIYDNLTMVDGITKFTSKAYVYATSPISWTPNLTLTKLSNTYNNIPINALKIKWDSPSSISQLDGYTILYTEKNGSCGSQYEVYADVPGSDKKDYFDIISRLESSKTYCFKIYGYKSISPLVFVYHKIYFEPDNGSVVDFTN